MSARKILAGIILASALGLPALEGLGSGLEMTQLKNRNNFQLNENDFSDKT